MKADYDNAERQSRQSLNNRLDALLNHSARPSLDSPTEHNMRKSIPLLKWTSQGALDEAINTPLPTKPPLARLPPSFRASRHVTHPPPFLANLTRSTMPTASLSPPFSVENRSPLSTQRSSLDSLRSFTRTLTTDLQPTATISSASSSKWWFQSDTFFSAGAEEDPVPQKPVIKKKYLSPINPVVFCHGLLGFDSVKLGPAIAPFEVTHWRGIKEVLEENGTEVFITRVPATSSPVDRAKVLEEKISAVYPGRSVHLIGHSMGGLDCRYLTTHLINRKFTVLSITTIATPHRGSSFADHFISTVGRDHMPSVLSLLDMLPNGGGDGAAFESLTVEGMKRFNEETPDVLGVKYFSWGAVYEPGLIDTWKWPHSVILEKEGPNDGLVSVESSKWGTYLGTLSQVNHLDLVGWINTARYKWAEIMGKEIEFRPATFYLGIADMLAREVEGQANPERTSESTISDPRLSGKVGDGVVLEEGEAATVTPANKGKGKGRASTEQEKQKQMVDSLDTAGAEVHNIHSNIDNIQKPSSCASTQSFKSLTFFTPNIPHAPTLPPAVASSSTPSGSDTREPSRSRTPRPGK